jgi:hypothetical protein
MKIKKLRTESNGNRSVEIRSNEVSYRALIRSIRRIPGAVVIYAAHDPMNDNAKLIVGYKDVTLNVETPFSDYIVNCSSSSDAFDEFVEKLSSYSVKWWERLF